MCYHTICLYSLCGHTSVSQRPIRNLPPCSHQSAAASLIRTARSDQKNSQTDPVSTSSTASPLVLSFPSPQEFEFARELHHSIPASPISPILTQSKRTSTASRNLPLSHHIGNDQQSFNILADYCNSPLSSFPSPSPPPYQQQPRSPKISCQTPQSHPLHTFTIPTLCRPCHILRASNLARFEARAIRDSVEREGSSARNRWGRGPGQTREIVQRKKISGVKGGGGLGKGNANGRLIPLICVEEGRWRGEIMEGKERDGGLSGGLGEGGVEMDADAVGFQQLDGVNEPSLRDTGNKSSLGIMTPTISTFSPAPSTSHMTTLTTPPSSIPQPFSSSMWSRWISRTPSPKPGSTIFTAATTPEPHLEHDRTGQHAEDLRTSSLPAKQNTSHSSPETRKPFPSAQVDSQESWNRTTTDIPRDAAGRNVKGMQRILGWDNGGS